MNLLLWFLSGIICTYVFIFIILMPKDGKLNYKTLNASIILGAIILICLGPLVALGIIAVLFIRFFIWVSND